MKLYTTAGAPNHRRVAIFLAEKGIDIEQIQVDLRAGENLAEGHRARNPFGRIPVLELDDGTHLSESVAICRYFEGTHPQPPLFGTTPLEQASIEMWTRRAELNFMNHVAQAFRHIRGFFKDREAVFPEWGQANAEIAAQNLVIFEQRLGESPYLAGDAFSVADITFVSALDFARATKQELDFDTPNLRRWLDTVKARPSYQAA